MSSEQEEQMVELLQRLCEWNTQPLDDEPRIVLKNIIADAETLLDELGVPLWPVRPREPLVLPTKPATASSEETSEPSKNPQPATR